MKNGFFYEYGYIYIKMLARQIEKSDIILKRDNFASLEFFLKDEQNGSKYTYIGEVNTENEMDGYGKFIISAFGNN